MIQHVGDKQSHAEQHYKEDLELGRQDQERELGREAESTVAGNV